MYIQCSLPYVVVLSLILGLLKEIVNFSQFSHNQPDDGVIVDWVISGYTLEGRSMFILVTDKNVSNVMFQGSHPFMQNIFQHRH